MKRKLCVIVAVLLSASLLGGFTMTQDYQEGVPGFPSAGGTEELCRFSEMPYVRPDLAAFEEAAEEIETALDAGVSFHGLVKLLDKLQALYDTACTMYTIADIRNCRDLTDEFYAEEYAWCLPASAEIERIMERVLLLCGASEYGPRLEREYFWEGFLEEYGPEAESMLTEEYVELAAQEGGLIARYRSLTARPVFEFDGEDMVFPDALNDARSYREYQRMLEAYYDQYNPLLGELYLQLVQVRRQEAELLGYGSAADMMFDIGYARDYTAAEASAFLSSVQKELVPLYLRYGSSEVRDWLLEESIEEETLFAVLDTIGAHAGQSAEELWQLMRRYELVDLEMNGNKADMSFQTWLNSYGVPFLFINPYGDLSDIITVAHEFGHCLEAYESGIAYRSIDLAEVFSHAMQFLAMDMLEEEFGREAVDQLLMMNLLDALDAYIQQCAFAEFEQQVYAMEEPTLEKLNDLSLRLAIKYGYYDGESEAYYAMSWIGIPHFFEQAFYVLSYPVSMGTALEIYELELAQKGAGLERYHALVAAGHTGIIGAAEEVGLKNPIMPERVSEIAAFLTDTFDAVLNNIYELPAAA